MDNSQSALQMALKKHRLLFALAFSDLQYENKMKTTNKINCGDDGTGF